MIILTGPSASGKTEIAKILFLKYGIRKVITHTTRPIRPSETADVDYHFVTEETFQKLNTEHYFVETTLYNTFHYGTSYTELGDNKVLIVDPNGLKAFIALNNPRFVTFYIDASETTRINRMIIRGQDFDFAKQRIAFDRQSFNPERLPTFNYVINNEVITIEAAADHIYSLYKQHIK
jgi:guanylate kinase